LKCQKDVPDVTTHGFTTAKNVALLDVITRIAEVVNLTDRHAKDAANGLRKTFRNEGLLLINGIEWRIQPFVR